LRGQLEADKHGTWHGRNIAWSLLLLDFADMHGSNLIYKKSNGAFLKTQNIKTFDFLT
jgi:hypothetical protein